MARLPYINPNRNRLLRTQMEFRGLNQTLAAMPGEFSDMVNCSDQYYPAVAARKPRGTTETILSTPNGLIYKNHLFYVDGEKCYYDGEEVPDLTVTDGRKQLVGMGAYICIFPDKKVYNTATREITQMAASWTQSGTATISELSTDSVFAKISASGIDKAFKAKDGVKIDGVKDSAFELDGDGVTKVITEIGDGYIVVTASIQNTFSGKLTLHASEAAAYLGKLVVHADGIGEKFSVSDKITIIGSKYEDLNVKNATILNITADGSSMRLDVDYPTKSLTQSKDITFAPYYSGSDKTKIYGTDLKTIFNIGDVVTITGAKNSAYNKSLTVEGAGTNFIIVDGTLTASSTQSSGIKMTSSRNYVTTGVVKRTSFTRSSGITIKRESQDFDYVCELDNRLWACNSENHEIYASKLGDPTNWNCFEGISTDSYAVTVGSDEKFTGCIANGGHVLFFKEGTIHMMYGDRPTNFALSTADLPGVMDGCADSMEVVNETLYYVGRNGVYAYDGAIPVKISDNITDPITEAVSCQQDGKLYISCKMGGKQTVLVYDPRLRIWDKENDDTFKYAVYGDGKGYFIDADNKLRTITGDDTDVIEWMIESPDLREDSLLEKYIGKLLFNFWLQKGSIATVYLKYDDSPMWIRKGTVTASVDTTYTLPIVPQRCHKYRYKIIGKGDGKLLSSGRYVEGGTELNGSIYHGHRSA